MPFGTGKVKSKVSNLKSSISIFSIEKYPLICFLVFVELLWTSQGIESLSKEHRYHQFLELIDQSSLLSFDSL